MSQRASLGTETSTVVGGDVKPSDIQMYFASMPESTLVGSPPCKLLWEVTTKQDFPHPLFLAPPPPPPPVTSCLVCSSQLKTHNHPTAVICYTLEGHYQQQKLPYVAPTATSTTTMISLVAQMGTNTTGDTSVPLSGQQIRPMPLGRVVNSGERQGKY